jgi:uncharacterized membrane protein
MDSFKERPRIRPALNNVDILLEVLGWVTLILIWILTFIKYQSLPDTIPVHFNAAGNVDQYGGKGTILMLPIIATLLFAGLTILNRYPYIFNYPVRITPDNAERQYMIAARIIRHLKFTIPATLLIIEYRIYTIATGKASGLGSWLLPVTVAVILLPVIIAIIKAIGIK